MIIVRYKSVWSEKLCKHDVLYLQTAVVSIALNVQHLHSHEVQNKYHLCTDAEHCALFVLLCRNHNNHNVYCKIVNSTVSVVVV